jgi:hypothetical protein
MVISGRIDRSPPLGSAPRKFDYVAGRPFVGPLIMNQFQPLLVAVVALSCLKIILLPLPHGAAAAVTANLQDDDDTCERHTSGRLTY